MSGPSSGVARVVDIHNHLIPGVDDGARDADEARAGLEAMIAGGVLGLVVTPHLDASLGRRPARLEERLAEIDAGWAALTRVAATLPRAPRLERGAEVKLDTPEPDLSDPRTRLAGGRFALVEFPYFNVPPRSETVLEALRRQDVTPVIAHPERYRGLRDQLETVATWRAAGAYLQVNGASLVGRYGAEARTTALLLLRRGWADYVSSDYHARGRTEIESYRAILLELGGEERTDRLLYANAARLLEGEPPLPVPALPLRRGFWERIAGAFRRSQRPDQTPRGRASAPRSTHSRK